MTRTNINQREQNHLDFLKWFRLINFTVTKISDELSFCFFVSLSLSPQLAVSLFSRDLFFDEFRLFEAVLVSFVFYSI